MENKYYTPTIEEFHVGFEFEFAGLDNNWTQYEFEKHKVLPTKDIVSNGLYTLEWVQKMFEQDNLYPVKNYIRVKHLDREDIEDCGWKADNRNYLLMHHYLTPSGMSPLTLIQDEVNTVFLGKIRNKSELKKIMQQLGIDESNENFN